MNNLSFAAPEIFLALGACAVLLAGVLPVRRAFSIATGMGLAVLAGTAVFLFYVQGGVAFGGMLTTDAFARYGQVFILAAGGGALLLAVPYLEKIGAAHAEYPALVLFATLGMMLMAGATDLTVLYAGLELQSLGLAILATLRRDHAAASEAGLKYFILSALASGILLYGLSLLYGLTGGTRFALLAELLRGDGLSLGAWVALAFVLAGFAFKISIVPFHMWTPDVYERAPTCVTFFFASAAKIAALCLLVRLAAQPFAAMMPKAQQVMAVLAVASMYVGALGGLPQTRLKRLLAYSAIANMGTALVGLAVGGAEGTAALLIYAAFYLVGTLGAFAALLALHRKGEPVDGLADMAGLSETHPVLAGLMALFMFSLAGVPPLLGFFGKYFIFLAAVEKGAYALTILGVLASVVAAGYYLKVVKTMYFDPLPVGRDLDPAPYGATRIVLGAAAFLIFALLVFPAVLTDSATSAAASLWNG